MSVTVPPKGTRGSRFPRAIFRLFSRFVPSMFRRRQQKTSGGIPIVRLTARSADSAAADA